MIKKFVFIFFAAMFLCNCAFAGDCEIVHKSIKYYENKVYEEDMSNACTYYNLAEEYLRKNKIKDALYAYNKVIELEPKEENAYIKRATLYSKFNDQAKADMEYARLVKNIPDSVAGNNGLANVYYRVLDFNNAIKYMNKAIALDGGKSSLLFLNRGEILKDAGYYERAINDYTRFIEAKQYKNNTYKLLYAIAHDERGECYKTIDKIDEANADKQEYENYFKNNKGTQNIFSKIKRIGLNCFHF